MRALNRREQGLAGLTAGVVVFALAVNWVFAPQLAKYTRLKEQVAGLNVNLTRMRANMVLKDQIEDRYEQLKGLIHEAGSPDQEMARFARTLSSLYGAMRPRAVRPLPDEDEGFYRKFSLSMEMEGPVAELCKFLAATARTDDPIRIERMEIFCKDRPDVVTAQIVAAKVVTTSRPAAGERRSSPRSYTRNSGGTGS